MKKHLLLCLSLLLPLTFSAAEQPQEGYLSSTSASYDGSALVLSGHVVLDHGLGKMTAEEASLERQEATSKDFPFSLIHLRKEVLLSLKSSAKLMCDAAELDFTSLKGQLTSPHSGVVSYTDSLPQKGGTQAPLSLKSPKIELSLVRSEAGDKKAEYDVDTILAKDTVTIEYNKQFVLQADHALYRKAGLTSTSAAKEFQGIITAYPKDASSFCTLTHGDDTVEASSIDIDLTTNQIAMHKPKGHLASTLVPQMQKGDVTFTSDFMQWDSPLQTLTLKGRSEVKESMLGTLITEEELRIQQGSVKGKTVINKIQTRGPTELVYQEAGSSVYHKLACHGTLKIDREHLQALLTSPTSEGSRPAFADQVYYEEMNMGAYADNASVEYSMEGEALRPVSLSLKGNVCLFSRSSVEPFRCSIADRMSYSPTTKTLILSANPGQKVLFWDEQQSVRMSAQEVHLTQNPTTGQTVIQGVGTVKFSLSSEENETLKKFFPQYKPLP